MEVRKSGRHWQEFYEKWMLLGEDDPYWSQFQKEETESVETDKNEKTNQKELFSQLLKMTEKIDMDKVQKQVQQLSGTVSTIQEVIGQFQENKKTPSRPINNSQRFRWFQD